MSEPIVFISHFRVTPGRLEDLKQRVREVTAELEAEKPRTVLFSAYLDENGTNATFVHVFGDAAAMDLHFDGAEQRSAAAADLLAPTGWEIYGTPSQAVIQMMRQAATASNVSLSLTPSRLAGFLRA